LRKKEVEGSFERKWVLSSDNCKGLATAMEFYLADVNILEPAISERYEKVIPAIDLVLPRFHTR
jgi:hypothetical protein